MILSLLNATVGLQTTLQFKFYCEGVLTYRTTIGQMDEYKGIIQYEIDFVQPANDCAGLVFTEYDDLSGLIPSENIGPSYLSNFKVFEVREYWYDGLEPKCEIIYSKQKES